ncbi:MAG: hypothetical protein V2I82_17510 [Halieaceae bacterium]|jgi:hypothetical protein|nr:hypothetical protein [Halieaceae bacterium]
MAARYRLIWFQHFHKAGGTSVVELARRNGEVLWPRQANGNPLDDRGNVIPLWGYSCDRLTDFVDRCERLGITFIATEWGLPLVGALRQDPRVTLVTCLRHPLDRLVSNFYFDVHYGYTAARSLDAFVTSGDGAHSMFDYYTRILSRHGAASRPVDRPLYDSAVRALGSFHDCVILETGLEALSARLGWTQTSDAHCNRGSLNPLRLYKILRCRDWRRLGRVLRWPRRHAPAEFVMRFQDESPWDLRLYAQLRFGQRRHA